MKPSAIDEKKFETRFESVLDLARLPWFEARDGRLVLADRSLGPAIDVHTHLAFAFVLPRRVDLRRGTPETRHYLPMEGRALDLELYVNKNFTPGDLRRMRRDLTLLSLTGCGMRATHTAPNLLREMDDLGILRSVLLPIDFPFLSRNAKDFLAAAAGQEKLIGFASVHPFAPDLERRLDEQVAAGACGIKVHPAMQLVPPEHERCMRLYRLCGERKLPVLWHCGPVDIEPWLSRRFSQVRRYRRPIEECPGTTFILGHSGALQLDEGIALARRNANVRLEIASQSLPGVRKLLAECDPDRIMYGTDWPFYPQAIMLAKVFMATEGNDELRRRILWRNAARLLKLEAPAMGAERPGRDASREPEGAAAAPSR